MSSLPTTPQAGRPSSSLHFVVGEMSGKLDQLMGTLTLQLASLRETDLLLSGRIDRLDEVVTTFVPRGEISQGEVRLGDRVTALETDKWKLVGFVTIAGALMAVWEVLPSILHFTRVFH